MGSIQTEMLCIKLCDVYNKPAFYRYMSKAIFDALEDAFLKGVPTAYVPSSDYLKMQMLININQKPQQQ